MPQQTAATAFKSLTVISAPRRIGVQATPPCIGILNTNSLLSTNDMNRLEYASRSCCRFVRWVSGAQISISLSRNISVPAPMSSPTKFSPTPFLSFWKRSRATNEKADLAPATAVGRTSSSSASEPMGFRGNLGTGQYLDFVFSF